MYHRFNENKYPSTNIRMEIFKEQMMTIKNLGYDFLDPKNLIEEYDKPKNTKKSGYRMSNVDNPKPKPAISEMGY